MLIKVSLLPGGNAGVEDPEIVIPGGRMVPPGLDILIPGGRLGRGVVEPGRFEGLGAGAESSSSSCSSESSSFLTLSSPSQLFRVNLFSPYDINLVNTLNLDFYSGASNTYLNSTVHLLEGGPSETPTSTPTRTPTPQPTNLVVVIVLIYIHVR